MLKNTDYKFIYFIIFYKIYKINKNNYVGQLF